RNSKGPQPPECGQLAPRVDDLPVAMCRDDFRPPRNPSGTASLLAASGCELWPKSREVGQSGEVHRQRRSSTQSPIRSKGWATGLARRLLLQEPENETHTQEDIR